MFNLHGIESKPGGVVVTMAVEAGYEYRINAQVKDREKKTPWTAGQANGVMIIKVPYGNTAIVPDLLTLEIRNASDQKIAMTVALDRVASRDYLELGMAADYVDVVKQVLPGDQVKALRDAFKIKGDVIQLANATKLQAIYTKQLADLSNAIITDTVVTP